MDYKYCKCIKRTARVIKIDNGYYTKEFNVGDYFVIIGESKGMLPYLNWITGKADTEEYEYIIIRDGVAYWEEYKIEKKYFYNNFKEISCAEYEEMPSAKREQEEYELNAKEDCLLYRVFKYMKRFNAYEDDEIDYTNRRIDLKDKYILIYVDDLEEKTFNIEIYDNKTGCKTFYSKQKVKIDELENLIDNLIDEYDR